MNLVTKFLLAIPIAAAMTAAAAYAAPSCGGHGSPKSMLVSTKWLASRLSTPGLAVLEVGDRQAYDHAHIPGAAFLDYQDLSAKNSALTLELAPMNQLADAFRALGVSNDSRVVVYAGKGGRVIQATRVYLTLDAMGMGDQTSILDGGMQAWQSESLPVSTEAGARKSGTLTPCAEDDVLVDNGYVAGNLRHPGIAIVDARMPEFYTGQSTSAGKRTGHIPGAVNLPFSKLVDAQGKLLSTGALRDAFKAAGIRPSDRVVSYCHIGLQATMVYFAARYLGYDARLYDGSWEEWSAHAELPAEIPARK